MKSNHTFSMDTIPLATVATAYVVETSWGGRVILLEPHTELTPEDIATVQAQYSRSNKPITQRIIGLLEEARNAQQSTGGDAKITKLESAKSRIVGLSEKGYGHKSIGDLGHIVLCYENVSMLAAKAIQDSQLYAGQEASTRYITFDKQPFLFHLPGKGIINSQDSDDKIAQLLEQMRAFYLQSLPRVREKLLSDYPFEEQVGLQGNTDEEKRQNYTRAINARSFDITRGLLPAGCSTNLAWYTSMSHCADHLGWLRCHVLEEVQELAQATQFILSSAYPLSFEGRTVYEEREHYKTRFYEDRYYLETLPEQSQMRWRIDNEMLQGWRKPILKRPKGQELHYTIGECGDVFYSGLLCFGSFRDQQRHRAVVQRHGLLTFNYGFHSWYLQEMPEDLRDEAILFLQQIEEAVNDFGLDKFNKQYVIPMGYQICVQMNGPLGKMYYIVDLRAQTTVHPTLHANMFKFGTWLNDQVANALELVDGESVPNYMNSNVGAFSLKRGTQTIKVAGEDISEQ